MVQCRVDVELIYDTQAEYIAVHLDLSNREKFVHAGTISIFAVRCT